MSSAVRRAMGPGWPVLAHLLSALKPAQVGGKVNMFDSDPRPQGDDLGTGCFAPNPALGTAMSRPGRPFRPRVLDVQRLEDRTLPATIAWDGGPTGNGTDWI